jgi:hypothetical protein
MNDVIETAPWQSYDPEVKGLTDLNHRCKARFSYVNPDSMFLSVRLEIRETSFDLQTPVTFTLPDGVRLRYASLPAVRFQEIGIPVRGYAIASVSPHQLSTNNMTWMFFDTQSFELIPYKPMMIAVCTTNGIIRIDN